MAKRKRSARYQLDRSKFLTEDEKLCLTMRPLTVPQKDLLAIALLFATGARAQEMLNLRPCDIDHLQMAIEITGLKGSLNRTIPLPDALYLSLCEYIRLNMIASDEPIINLTYRTLDRHWKDYAPPGKTIHSTRHTFAIELYRKTKDLRLVQVALGHVNIANTMIYAQYVHSTEELRRAML